VWEQAFVAGVEERPAFNGLAEESKRFIRAEGNTEWDF
jgi:hypothetical protein